MKRVLFVIFIFSSFFSKAQFGIAPKFGIEFSSDIVLESLVDLSYRKKSFVGSTYSLSLMVGKGSVFHFQPEFYYSQIGSRYYFKDDNITYTQTRNYGGLNVLFDIGFTKNQVRFYLQPGFYIAYLTSGLLEINSSGQKTYSNLHNANAIYGDYGFPFDFGYSFGFGLEYKLAKGWLSLNPRFKFGLLPHSSDSYIEQIALLNKSFSINLSYIFVFGRKA